MSDNPWQKLQLLTDQIITTMKAEQWSDAEVLQQQRHQLITQWVPLLQQSLPPEELRQQILAIQALDKHIGQFAQTAIDGAMQTSRKQVNAGKAIKHYRTQSRHK